MDWVGAVDVVQHMARALVFKTCGVGMESELHEACAQMNLPLNAGKSVVASVHGALFGGEVDGIRGWLSHSREVCGSLVAKAAALLGMPVWRSGPLQHWIGCFCFGASFRRPLFAVLQDAFSFAAAVENEASAPDVSRGDEILGAAILAPLMFTNLRAPVRAAVSCSDASEAGGGAAEATDFVDSLGREFECQAEALVAKRAEESAWADAGVFEGRCVMGCAGGSAAQVAARHFRRGRHACSLDSLLRHACGQHAVRSAFVEVCSAHGSPELSWAVARRAVYVLPPTQPGRVPEAAWAHWSGIVAWTHEAQAQAWRPASSRRAVRGRARPLGLPHLPHRLQAVVSKGTREAMTASRSIESQLCNCRVGSFMHLVDSFIWHLPLARTLLSFPGVSLDPVRGDATVDLRVLHCSQALHQKILAGGVDQQVDWRTLLAAAVHEDLARADAAAIPAATSLGEGWARAALGSSTARLRLSAEMGLAAAAISGQLASVRQGVEMEHLRGLLRNADYKGSDVRLVTGELVDGCRQAAEYVNHVCQEGEPRGYAATFVSGLKRLYPKCRKRLDIATQYCKNWTNTLRRKRAMPLPANVVVGMAGMAYAFGEDWIGISFLVGFFGLLRTGELLGLTVGHIK
ncbi:unnamed protein product, partial [Prorocentrum cordatum]